MASLDLIKYFTTLQQKFTIERNHQLLHFVADMKCLVKAPLAPHVSNIFQENTWRKDDHWRNAFKNLDIMHNCYAVVGAK